MFNLRILLSFFYYRTTDLEKLLTRDINPQPEVFSDSGAFSAFTKGQPISAEQYGYWLIKWRKYFQVMANLDVIGDPESTLVNQGILESMGLPVLPVFHTGDDFKYLEQYLEQYQYIALGGMVPYLRNAESRLMAWLVKCFKLAEGKAVFHGFGCTSWLCLKAFPWYSVDSSSWGQGFRYGQVPLFDERRGKFVDVHLGDRRSCYKQAAIIRECGFDPEDFSDRKRNDRAKICGLSALSYMKAESWLRKRHGEIFIPNADTPAVLRAYQADANPVRYVEAQAGLRLHIADGASANLSDAATGIKVYLSGLAKEY